MVIAQKLHLFPCEQYTIWHAEGMTEVCLTVSEGFAFGSRLAQYKGRINRRLLSTMAQLKKLLKAIEDSPKGPGIAAIFDYDGTLIAGFSAPAFIREQLRRGVLKPRELLQLMNAMASFGLGKTGFSAMMLVNAQFMRGSSEESYVEMGEKLYREQTARLIYPESRTLVEAHQARGHTVAIISSATPYQIGPAGRDLGIKHLLCSHLEVLDGEFTGGVIRPTCFGEGKVTAAEALAQETGADLDQSFFYSDSTDDLQLLERVGHPCALNPSRKLLRVAQQNHWSSAQFGSRGRPSVNQLLRSVAATGSVVGSFAAGLPIWALTGNRRDAQNFSFSLFADAASALIGMKLEVDGEEHLWSHRPAVFVFNHQSKADVIIIARLLRRDFAGIGKQEIKKVPLIGKVLQFSGVVFIDRSNTGSAIEAMGPLVVAIKDERKSVVIAPEGTRTVSPRLAPFKKGAFHLAIQAGVPIIPIVIHNSLDVAPKGDFVFRSATVHVDVLPPVDTSHWSSDSIDEHVGEVRAMFEQALGQTSEPAAAVSSKKPRARSKANPKAKTATTATGNKKSATKAQPGARGGNKAKLAGRPAGKRQIAPK
jgi:putative phosphoserine phosphatase/1-acylglycerol-3-phosphate O-acyltransferase